MSEGSILLKTAIAGILGLAIVKTSIEEQVPSCVLATATRATATASCPVGRQFLHDHNEPKALLLPTIGYMTGLGISTSVAFGALKNATPDVVSAVDCPDKAKAPLHLERKDAVDEEMPFLLRNSAANFFAQEQVPTRRQFIQPDQVTNPALLALQSCPDKDHWPQHVDGDPSIRIAAPSDDELALNYDAPLEIMMNEPEEHEDIAQLYDSAPCPEKDHAPPHIDGENGLQLQADVIITPGTGSMNFASAAPQVFENPAPVFIPSRPSCLVTILTQYPDAPQTA